MIICRHYNYIEFLCLVYLDFHLYVLNFFPVTKSFSCSIFSLIDEILCDILAL